jgi:hypothetical protein
MSDGPCGGENMRLRSSLTAVGVVSLLTMGVLAACGGGDDSGNGGSTPDASTGGNDSGIITTDSGPVDSGPAAPTAAGSDVAIYVGQLAQLDASASTPPNATFAWTVTSAPAGSTIVTASLTGATTAKPTFTPDLVGDYALKVVVTANGLSANKSITVHAHPGKTFFGHVDALPDAGAISEVRFANTDGTGKSTVSCDTTVRTGQSALDTLGSPYAQDILIDTLDWQEGAPADDPKVVFGFRDVVDDGGFTNYLAVGKGSSTCATLAKVDPIVNAGNLPQGTRIAPNGDRAAFVRNSGTSVDIATVGLDGTNLRILGQMFIGDAGTNAAPTAAFETPRVQWIDESHVAWIANMADEKSFSIYVASDSATPAAASIMDCAAATSNTQPLVNEFAVLPGGNVLVDGTVTTFDAGLTGSQLVLLAPDPTTKQCTFVRSIGNGASDFSISPDGNTLAFVQENDAGTSVLFTAPVSGSTDPTAVAFGDAGLPAESSYGPRWVNGGARLVLTDPETYVDGGSGTNIVSIAPSGGTRTVVATGTSTESFYSPGSIWSCSTGGVGGAFAPVSAFGAVGLFFGLVLRRRKRSTKNS